MKLINSISMNADEGEEANVAKRMNILMMRQLDSMDRRMERREKEEEKEAEEEEEKEESEEGRLTSGA